jgi:NAD(P)-dependent dehydrogenase (short-subunit alcohol dehydrogenase family)
MLHCSNFHGAAMDLMNRVAVVTGGGSGIGMAVATAMASGA